MVFIVVLSLCLYSSSSSGSSSSGSSSSSSSSTVVVVVVVVVVVFIVVLSLCVYGWFDVVGRTSTEVQSLGRNVLRASCRQLGWAVVSVALV